jgi:non-ribosomal peptide synthetase component E (peptide arylation enzyme)
MTLNAPAADPTATDPWPRGVARHLSVPATGLAHNLAVSAARYPAKPAIVFYGRSITYAELADRVTRLAGHLTAQGVQPGDRVLLTRRTARPSSPRCTPSCTPARWRCPSTR